MNVTTRLPLHTAIVIALAAAASPAQAQSAAVAEQKLAVKSEQGVLAAAKNLYASASYEEALLELNASNTRDDAEQIDTYRALCFLALDRQRDAERTLENIVTRKPLYVINDAEYSPRLVSMFRDVRKRALPAAAQQLYSAAKIEYDGKNYEGATAKFKQLFSVLSDPETDPTGKLVDLRELADGFLKLSEQKLSATLAPPVQKPSAPAAVPVRAPVTYTSGDDGIRPPLVISQTLPDWQPPQKTQYLRSRTYSGRLELVIDEQGSVEKAILVTSIWPSYDAALLLATKQWRYQPAQKDGKPVKFVKFLDVTMNSANTAQLPASTPSRSAR